jgi:hypothetical protein
MKLLPKTRVASFLVALMFSLSLVGAPASSTDATRTHEATSPLIGSWLLDTARLPMPPDQRPKSVRFSFDDVGGGKWTVQVDIVYAPGQEVHSLSTVALDGTLAIVQSSPEADHVQLKRPAPNVLVMALLKGGVLVSTRIYAVMPDGQHLVETAVYPGQESGLAVMKTSYFERVH